MQITMGVRLHLGDLVCVRACMSMNIRKNFWLLFCFSAYKSSAVLKIGIVCFSSEKKVRVKFMRLNQMCICVGIVECFARDVDE